jgi:hypothetical protein
MCDKEQSFALPPTSTIQQIDNIPCGLLIKITGWFIGQDERGIVGKSSCDRDTLLLATA